MAPMTRARCGPDGIVTPSHAAYYAARAEAGLIVTEAVNVSPQATGFAFTPGLYTDAQEAAWRGVADAVAARGGRIAMELVHCGRVSHSRLQPDGGAPVAPSALPPPGSAFTAEGMLPYEAPRALEVSEIRAIHDDFARAATRAFRAGFDAVLLHGAGGFLIEQFLCEGSNRRSDGYGGSIPSRLRFLAELVDALGDAVDLRCVGARLSPFFTSAGAEESRRRELYVQAARMLDARGVAVLEIVERSYGSAEVAETFSPDLRRAFRGALMLNGGYDAARAAAAIRDGDADLVSFGRPFLGNPDLVARIHGGMALRPDLPKKYWYGGGDAGHVDLASIGTS